MVSSYSKIVRGTRLVHVSTQMAVYGLPFQGAGEGFPSASEYIARYGAIRDDRSLFLMHHNLHWKRPPDAWVERQGGPRDLPVNSVTLKYLNGWFCDFQLPRSSLTLSYPSKVPTRRHQNLPHPPQRLFRSFHLTMAANEDPRIAERESPSSLPTPLQLTYTYP
jgi:hypothetical protein